ncbi:FAD-dependent oxidoreductase [Nevskia sp.]|uniref:NAD(P)/FAD-dependent oxidoreductase n=1 Tax=Nevskia sp. TaxID=1929292 RepID=UPI00345753A2
MAGIRTVEELLKLDGERYDITVFGTEPHGNYNRILLSPVLAGEKQFEDIVTHDRAWYAKHGILLYAGNPVVAIDRKRRVVKALDGLEVQYDRLLIATGSKPFIIPVPGHQLPGVIAFRDINDVETMIATARSHRHAVVIGGGLLGLEAANGLLRQGMNVSVVHVMDSLMERQLDKPAAKLLKVALEKRGMRFLLEANTAEIVGSDRVTAIKFKDGSEIPADLVVMAVGIRPNVELAKTAGLHVERAIVVDDTLQSLSDPRIYAVGECVQHRKNVYGLVAPLWDQAKVCAAHLAGFGHRRYGGSVTATRLKVTGIDLYSAGDFIGDKDSEDLVLRDPGRGVYKRLVLKGGCIVGVVLYGEVSDGPWYFELMQARRDITQLRQRLLFGRAYCEPQAA